MNDNSPSGGVSTSKLVGSSIPGLTAGTYYIAVAKSGAMPIGFKNPDNDPLPLFTYNPGSTAVVLPTGTQATYTLADWSNLGDGGDYQIEFGGTVVTRSSACSSAIILGSGVYSFGNAGASDSSASRIGLDATCSDNGAWIANPSWFELGACDGAVQISVCPTVTTATYQMVVYEGSCGDLEPVACGTLGACSGGGTGSTVTLNPDPCKTYYVAFGARRVSGASPTSAGTITITCTPAAERMTRRLPLSRRWGSDDEDRVNRNRSPSARTESKPRGLTGMTTSETSKLTRCGAVLSMLAAHPRPAGSGRATTVLAWRSRATWSKWPAAAHPQAR